MRMKNLVDYDLEDLKLVYRTLHAQLAGNTELIDSQLLHDLQTLLQREAKKQGVSIADHGQWDTWLGNEATPCDVRMQGRHRLD